jgi:hypothetical protein
MIRSQFFDFVIELEHGVFGCIDAQDFNRASPVVQPAYVASAL